MIALYAIAQGAPRGGKGARDEPLHVVHCSGLELVCGAAPPPISAEALRAHEAAVRRIAEGSEACLPARFGAGAGDEADLLRLVSPRAPELLEALALVRGREQMTVRLLGSREAAAPSGGPGTQYLEERRRAHTVPEISPLRTLLAGLVRAERVEPHAEEGLLASVYHLIDRGQAARYRQLVESASLSGMRASVSGPWPAWSFAPELSP